MSKVLYEPTEKKGEFNHLNRIGLLTEKDDEVQIDTLSYQSLDDKVLSILTGNPNFHAEDLETEYDEPEAETWDNVNEENLEPFPIDEYSSKEDVIEVQRNAQDKMNILQDEYKKSKEKTATIVDETKDGTVPNNDTVNETK